MNKITGTEFEIKLKEKDVTCLLADFLAKNSALQNSLKYTTQHTRDKYLERAETLIKKYEKSGLRLIAI